MEVDEGGDGLSTIVAAEDRLATDRAAVETTGLIADLNIVDDEGDKMEIRLGEMDDGWVEMQLLQLTQDSIRRRELVFLW